MPMRAGLPAKVGKGEESKRRREEIAPIHYVSSPDI